MRDKDLAELFSNCWANSLDSAIAWRSNSRRDPRTFVIPGDANVMFLRDSTTQVFSYVPYAKEDGNLKIMIRGVINMQAEFINKHPYGNAFCPPKNCSLRQPHNPWSGNDSCVPTPPKECWQSKWGADSLASFLKLSYHYWLHTGDDTLLQDKEWQKAVQLTVKTFTEQQRGTTEETNDEAYRFTRSSRNSHETLMLGGRGAPSQRTGLIKSQFRPSDDSSVFPFIIPTNAMISVELSHISEMYRSIDSVFAEYLLTMSMQIRQAIYDHARIHHLHFGDIFAYEIDGYGSFSFMDDANVPSLLSLPYLGFLEEGDSLYQATRQFVLSEWNKYWIQGRGVGSPHSGLGYFWPMSLCVKILTSTDDQEILETFEMLKSLAGKNGLLPQAVLYNDYNNAKRPWFPSVNALFGEAVLKVARERPYLLFQQRIFNKDLQPRQSNAIIEHFLTTFEGILGPFLTCFGWSGEDSQSQIDTF